MPTNELPENAIELTTAEIWVAKWRESDENLPVKGFLIPRIDLTEVLAEDEVVDVRTYMAIDPDDNDPQTMYHLLVVGVDSAGNDLLDQEKGQYVYDFTRPCPPTCSATGPLR